MAPVSCIIDPPHVESDPLDAAEASSLRGVFISLGFWFCLLAAAVTYTAAALSTTYVENQRLQGRHLRGEAELRRLAEQVERYERYCEMLTGIDGESDALTDGARSMAVDESLQFHLDNAAPADAAKSTLDDVPPILRSLSRSAVARRTLIGLSGVLLIFAFGMLIDSGGPPPDHPPRRPRIRQPLGHRLRSMRSRYQSAPGQRPE